MFLLCCVWEKSRWNFIYFWCQHANSLFGMFSSKICSTMLCLSSNDIAKWRWRRNCTNRCTRSKLSSTLLPMRSKWNEVYEKKCIFYSFRIVKHHLRMKKVLIQLMDMFFVYNAIERIHEQYLMIIDFYILYIKSIVYKKKIKQSVTLVWNNWSSRVGMIE